MPRVKIKKHKAFHYGGTVLTEGDEVTLSAEDVKALTEMDVVEVLAADDDEKPHTRRRSAPPRDK